MVTETSGATAPSSDGNKYGYQLVTSAKVNGQIPVDKYRSVNSGMTVIVAQVDGPVVNGYFELATEAHDHDGLPHTLEHLIFLGSDKYPYKGILDLLANRCLSSGTNAWTDTDHTCYTMTTAGSQGFLALMPVYLDHILFPTLTDSGFVTEVYHVDGNGEDGGVVYCEMQGTENDGGTKTYHATMDAIYPDGCGYKSETGGMMKNLRESTSNEKVRNYHKAFYRPENLNLIITGRVEASQVFEALQPIEAKIGARKAELWRQPFQRPWQTPIAKFEASKVVDVPYPADEEDNGQVYVAWRGPNVVTQLEAMFSWFIVMEYLTETSVSPLQANFVEIADPLASLVTYSFAENLEPVMYLVFKNVPLPKLERVESHLMEVLNKIVSGELAWDADRMANVINRRILEQLTQVEKDPHDAIAMMVIGDALYGNNDQHFRTRLDSVNQFRGLLDKSQDYWVGLIRDHLIDRPRVVTLGRPSRDLQLQMKADDEARIKARREALGPDGLEAKGRAVEAAMEENDRDPPDEVLRSVPIPSTDSIQFHPISTYTSNCGNHESTDSSGPPYLNLDHLPVYCQFDEVPATSFIYVNLIMDTQGLPLEQKLYLPLLMELLLESPVLSEDGALTPYEEVVSRLAKDFISTRSGLGVNGGHRFFPGAFAQSALLGFQIEPAKYATAVDWMRKLLYCTKFTADRIRVLGTKMENSVAELKRSGNKVTGMLLNSVTLSDQSNHHAANMIRQARFLKSLVAKLDTEAGAKDAVAQLELVRFHLTQPNRIMIHLAANQATLSKCGDPEKPWSSFLPPHIPKQISRQVPTPEFELLNKSSKESVICGIGSCESAFLNCAVEAISDWRHPDLPALYLYLQYLTQLEGPMWRQIRGQGFAYGYSMYPTVSKGQLRLSLYRATHPVKAYAVAKQIALSYVNGEEKFDVTLFESAKSSLIFEQIENEKSVVSAVVESLLSSFRGVDKKFNRDFLRRINEVTIEDLHRVGGKYISALFDGTKASTAVVCGPAKVQELKEGFKSHGLELRVLKTVDDCV